MTRLSILIPWVQNDRRHEDSLASVLANRPKQSEILVVHPGPYDDPYELSGEVRFLEGPASASLGQLINFGAEEAEGDVLHILQGGIEVCEGWAEPALQHFRDPSVSSVAPLILDAEEERVLSAGVAASGSGRRVEYRASSLRSTEVPRFAPAGPSLRAAFYRIEHWDAASGLDETMGDLADLDLALCLNELGECRLETESQLTAPSGLSGAASFGAAAMRLHNRFASRDGFSRLGFWLQNLTRLIGGCYRPSVWFQCAVEMIRRNDARDQARFARRFAELQEEAEELERIRGRQAA